jgi:hypothetical protein
MVGRLVLTLISDLPPNVVGVMADESVTAENYKTVLRPAVKQAESASADGKVRILYVLGHDFPKFTPGAAWEDTKLGLGQLPHWERIAIVSDADWLRSAIHALGWALPGEIRVFATSDLGGARAWVAE